MTDVQEDIQQIQMLEQSIQQLLVQKQSLQSELIEYESALEELSDDAQSWRMVGNIMVKTDAKTLSEDLSNKKSRIEKRLGTLEQQEQRMRERAQQMQKQVMERLEDGKD